MPETPSFYQLLREAVLHPIVGWDFEWVKGRIVRGQFPWNYTEQVLVRARRSQDLLDLGTGGGEWLAQLVARPSRTVATESYLPNVPVARARLGPLGVEVVRTTRVPDNPRHGATTILPRLPFHDGSFHVVADRNEAFVASEVARVLAPGGRFLTQQVGDGWNEEWYRLFDRVRPSPTGPRWTVELATRQLEGAGLKVLRTEEGAYATEFHDVGAVVWYLLAVPWTLPGFSVDRDVSTLKRIDRTIRAKGPLVVRFPGFFVEAERPGTVDLPTRPKRVRPSPSPKTRARGGRSSRQAVKYARATSDRGVKG